MGLVAGVTGVQTMFAQQGGPGGWGGRHSGPPNPQAVVRFSCTQIARIAKGLGNLNLSDDATGLKIQALLGSSNLPGLCPRGV
jgi:hypothetical protein